MTQEAYVWTYSYAEDSVNLFEDRHFQIGSHIFRVEHFSSENPFPSTYLAGPKKIPFMPYPVWLSG